MQRKLLSGVTLVELLATLTIISILGLSLPSFSNLQARQRLASSQSELRQLVNRARAEALALRQRITLCPLAPEGRCAANWAGTLSVFTDANGNRRKDFGETLLYEMQLDPSLRLEWRGMKPTNSLHFSAQGVTFVSNGTFSICSSSHTETFRLIVNRQGRCRTDRIKQDCAGNSTT